jgi:hypothetical protein
MISAETKDFRFASYQSCQGLPFSHLSLSMEWSSLYSIRWAYVAHLFSSWVTRSWGTTVGRDREDSVSHRNPGLEAGCRDWMAFEAVPCGGSEWGLCIGGRQSERWTVAKTFGNSWEDYSSQPSCCQIGSWDWIFLPIECAHKLYMIVLCLVLKVSHRTFSYLYPSNPHGWEKSNTKYWSHTIEGACIPESPLGEVFPGRTSALIRWWYEQEINFVWFLVWELVWGLAVSATSITYTDWCTGGILKQACVSISTKAKSGWHPRGLHNLYRAQMAQECGPL